MSVERLRTDVISNNIANASTTRTAEGGKFQKQTVILQSIGQETVFRNPYVPSDLDQGPGAGVKVSRIVSDTSQGRICFQSLRSKCFCYPGVKGYVQ